MKLLSQQKEDAKKTRQNFHKFFARTNQNTMFCAKFFYVYVKQ